MVGEGRVATTKRPELLEAPSLRHEYTSVSCPIIEQAEARCDIRLVVNGHEAPDTDTADAAAIPLLADA